MAGAKRFLSTVVTNATPSSEGIWQNITGKPLSVSMGAQALSTDRNACMTIAVGLGTTSFSKRVGVASGDFKDYFGTQSEGVQATGFSTTFGTFYLGQDCNCPGGSYCSSTSGIASYIAADGTETRNWQGGRNMWGCCICVCAGPYPDTSCSSWCANAYWGGQEQINYGLALYDEYTGKCWHEAPPYSEMTSVAQCASMMPVGWTNGGTCRNGDCRQHPPHNWLVHVCHITGRSGGNDQNDAAATWINHFCCCGKCNYENNSPGTMGICYGINDTSCGSYYNWYALTSYQPDVVSDYFCCDGGCNVCEWTTGRNMYCYTCKCPTHHHPGDIEVYLNWIARGRYWYCSCFCCQCGRWCRQRHECCCISSFTDCYSWLCCFCCWQHWSEGWTCNYQDCRMNPYGGVAGAATQCAIVRHHKTMQTCQMYFIGNMYACTWYCERCSCQMHILDLWIDPPKYGSTNCYTNEYAIKYLSWNPQKCCTYLAIRSKTANHCGVYSWFGSGQNNEYRDWQMNNQGWSCIWPCDATYFTKVADFPPAWTEDKYNCPIMCTTCIHRVEKCLWAIGVYNCDDKKMDPFISNDLINWRASPKDDSTCSEQVICSNPANCIVEYMNSTCKWRICTSFDDFVCKEGIIDYKLAFNNYERTGIILDCDQRVFIQNITNDASGIGTDFNFQVWGYEG